jgi:Tfp pilus assembly protein PilF
VKIFVSYSRKDAGDFAEQIRTNLIGIYDVFTDIDSISAGDVWSTTIETNISNCDIFVIIVTYQALRSQNVETEVLQAQRENKTIIPCLHKVVKRSEIKWGLNKIQGFEFDDKFELARNLSKILKNKKGSTFSPSAAPVRTVPYWRRGDRYYGDTVPSETKSPPLRPILISVVAVVIGIVIAIVIFGSGIVHQQAPPSTPAATENTSRSNQPSVTLSNVSALLSRGDIFYDQGNYKQAIQYYDNALAIDPNYKYALYGKGDSLNSLGNYTQAIQYYDKALAMDPNYKYALYGKGDSLNSLGNYTQAIQYYDKALAIDPNYKYALYGKGDSLNSLGNYTQAIQYYDKALAMDPNNVNALTGKGNALGGEGNYTQAIQYYDKALAMDPNNVNALTGKSHALSGQGLLKLRLPR